MERIQKMSREKYLKLVADILCDECAEYLTLCKECYLELFIPCKKCKKNFNTIMRDGEEMSDGRELVAHAPGLDRNVTIRRLSSSDDCCGGE